MSQASRSVWLACTDRLKLPCEHGICSYYTLHCSYDHLTRPVRKGMGQLSRIGVSRRDYCFSFFAQHVDLQLLEIVGTDISTARAGCRNYFVAVGSRMARRGPRKLACIPAERGGLFLHCRKRDDNSKAEDFDIGRGGILPGCCCGGIMRVLRGLSR